MGNETCGECAGVGQQITELKCNSCKGRGEFLSGIDCYKCNATGKIKKEFTSMSASNIQFCSSCGGNSTPDDPCTVCGGIGRLANLQKKTREIKCDWCNGRGKTKKCEDCLARGTIETKINCSKCDGKGKHKKGIY